MANLESLEHQKHMGLFALPAGTSTDISDDSASTSGTQDEGGHGIMSPQLVLRSGENKNSKKPQPQNAPTARKKENKKQPPRNQHRAKPKGPSETISDLLESFASLFAGISTFFNDMGMAISPQPKMAPKPIKVKPLQKKSNARFN